MPIHKINWYLYCWTGHSTISWNHVQNDVRCAGARRDVRRLLRGKLLVDADTLGANRILERQAARLVPPVNI